MDSKNFTPQESIELITRVISEARSKFQDNGFSFILWGSLSVIASLSQFFLLQMEYYNISHYPYFLMIIGGIIEYWYRAKLSKRSISTNVIYQSITTLWAVIGISVFVLAFGFYWSLQHNTSPLILIFLSLGILLTGLNIRDRIVIFAGIELNIAGFICFFVDWEYHPIVMAIATLIGILIPGVILRYRSKT